MALATASSSMRKSSRLAVVAAAFSVTSCSCLSRPVLSLDAASSCLRRSSRLAVVAAAFSVTSCSCLSRSTVFLMCRLCATKAFANSVSFALKFTLSCSIIFFLSKISFLKSFILLVCFCNWNISKQERPSKENILYIMRCVVVPLCVLKSHFNISLWFSPTPTTAKPYPWENSKLGYASLNSSINLKTPKSRSRTFVS